VKYEIVARNKARSGRNGEIEVHLRLAVARPAAEPRPTIRDVVLVIADSTPQSPLQAKDVGDTVEIG
jgi:hypothetical protein